MLHYPPRLPAALASSLHVSAPTNCAANSGRTDGQGSPLLPSGPLSFDDDPDWQAACAGIARVELLIARVQPALIAAQFALIMVTFLIAAPVIAAALGWAPA